MKDIITAEEFRRKYKGKKMKSKSKVEFENNLTSYCRDKKLDLIPEYKFHPKRKWRFDFALPDLKIAFEYEGLMSSKSRHTTIKGYTNDSKKYNAAQSLDWKVLRYTALNHRDVVDDLEELIKK